MITESQIANDEEWILRLKQILSLYETIENKDYVYNNYLDYGRKGSFFKEIEYRRQQNERKNDYIEKLENEILNIKK